MDLLIIGAVIGWFLTVLAQDLSRDWKSWKKTVLTPVEKWKEERNDFASRALIPDASLLEARDRKRDAKLLRAAEEASDDDGFPVDIWILADARESGEWQPELGD